MVKLRINLVSLGCYSKTNMAGSLSYNRMSAFLLYMAGRFIMKESATLVSSEHSHPSLSMEPDCCAVFSHMKKIMEAV